MADQNDTELELAQLKIKYEQLRQNEEMYRVALSLTDHTVTVVDIPNKALIQIYNEGDWTGVASSMPNAPESIIETGIIHPDDQEDYREFFNDIYSGIPKGECTMRVMEEERGWVWFKMNYQTIFDEEGNALKAIAFSDDITIRKKADLMYQQYRTAVTRDATYVWEVNLDENILIEEDAASGQLFNRASFSKYSDIVEVATKAVPENYRDAVGHAFSADYLLGEYAKARREVTLGYPFYSAIEDEMRWMESTAYMTATPEGTVNAIICARDITDRKREEERLRNAAERDALCGLYNRKAFEQRIASQLITDRRVRSGYLFMIDIDDFKDYNDDYGHIIGDEILRGLGRALQDCFRKGDLLGRFGGDEFMAFAPNITYASALTRAEELKQCLRELQCSEPLDRVVTISIGIAEVAEQDDFSSLYKKSDQALYTAKSKGKACSVVWSA